MDTRDFFIWSFDAKIQNANTNKKRAGERNNKPLSHKRQKASFRTRNLDNRVNQLEYVRKVIWS